MILCLGRLFDVIDRLTMRIGRRRLLYWRFGIEWWVVWKNLPSVFGRNLCLWCRVGVKLIGGSLELLNAGLHRLASVRQFVGRWLARRLNLFWVGLRLIIFRVTIWLLGLLWMMYWLIS